MQKYHLCHNSFHDHIKGHLSGPTQMFSLVCFQKHQELVSFKPLIAILIFDFVTFSK